MWVLLGSGRKMNPFYRSVLKRIHVAGCVKRLDAARRHIFTASTTWALDRGRDSDTCVYTAVQCSA